MQESKKAFSQPNKEEKTSGMPTHGQHHETKGARDEKNNPEQEDEETEEEEKDQRTAAQRKQPAKGEQSDRFFPEAQCRKGGCAPQRRRCKKAQPAKKIELSFFRNR